MSFLLKSYKLVLEKHPLGTQMVQTGLLMSAGDLISQSVLEKKPLKYINWRRNMEYFAIGALYVTPAVATWYKFLDKKIGHGGMTVGLQKVALDQIVIAPVMLAGFLTIIGLIRTQNVEEVKATIKEHYVDILFTNYKVWPAVQLVNFSLIPVQYQLLYVQCVALAWNTYVCFKTKPKE